MAEAVLDEADPLIEGAWRVLAASRCDLDESWIQLYATKCRSKIILSLWNRL